MKLASWLKLGVSGEGILYLVLSTIVERVTQMHKHVTGFPYEISGSARQEYKSGDFIVIKGQNKTF